MSPPLITPCRVVAALLASALAIAVLGLSSAAAEVAPVGQVGSSHRQVTGVPATPRVTAPIADRSADNAKRKPRRSRSVKVSVRQFRKRYKVVSRQLSRFVQAYPDSPAGRRLQERWSRIDYMRAHHEVRYRALAYKQLKRIAIALKKARREAH